MQQTTEVQPAKFGLLGFMLGVVSLVVILIQLSVFFEPQEKSAGVTIGEIAAEIKQSAARALSGEPAPAPDHQTRRRSTNSYPYDTQSPATICS